VIRCVPPWAPAAHAFLNLHGHVHEVRRSVNPLKVMRRGSTAAGSLLPG